MFDIYEEDLMVLVEEEIEEYLDENEQEAYYRNLMESEDNWS